MSRAEIIETMARAIWDATDSATNAECRRAASAALTALEASGMAVVPRKQVETLDEHIGALLRIFEASPVPSEADAERVLQIATAFGERCLAAALPTRSE